MGRRGRAAELVQEGHGNTGLPDGFHWPARPLSPSVLHATYTHTTQPHIPFTVRLHTGGLSLRTGVHLRPPGEGMIFAAGRRRWTGSVGDLTEVGTAAAAAATHKSQWVHISGGIGGSTAAASILPPGHIDQPAPRPSCVTTNCTTRGGSAIGYRQGQTLQNREWQSTSCRRYTGF